MQSTADRVINNLLAKLDVTSLEEVVEKLQKPTRLTWPQFDVPFAYYILYNKECNLVKAGAVGIENSEPLIKALDNRFSAHRSSFFGYQVLQVFVFNSAENVKFFEGAMRDQILIDDSLSKSREGLEQYYCSEFNTGEFVVSKATKAFTLFNYEARKFGHIMEPDLIDNYNKTRAKI